MAEKKANVVLEERQNQIMFIGVLVELLTIVFGIVMVFEPEFTNRLIAVVIGVFILLYAGSLYYSFFVRDGAKLYSLNIIFAIILTILAIAFIINPDPKVNYITFCAGLYFLVCGAIKIVYSMWLKKGEESSWHVVLANAVMLIILSIVLMFNNFISLGIIRVLGIILIAGAFIKLTDLLLFKKRRKEITKIFW